MGEITNSEKLHGPDDQPVKWHPKKTDKPKNGSIWITWAAESLLFEFVDDQFGMISRESHIIYDEVGQIAKKY